ncbi:MAG: AMP-binding protein, partial [bacterium]
MRNAGASLRDRLSLRRVPEALAARYFAEGWWNDQTLGRMVHEGLGRRGDTRFRVNSRVRPWSGTFRDVDHAARSLAASLRARGVGAGSVVVLQLPNWAEAGIAFWAAAYLGAVVVPVVHFYGSKEVGYILRTTRPDVVVTPERFGHTDHLEMVRPLLADVPDTLWLVVGDTPAADLPARAKRLAPLLDADPLAEPLAVDPDAPALVAFTSGTTRDPKGVVHSHRTIGFEVRQLDSMFPKHGPPHITGAPVGHFIGMLNAFMIPLLRERAVHLIDVWDPGEVLRIMVADGVNMSGGATYFLTSLLDHPDF